MVEERSGLERLAKSILGYAHPPVDQLGLRRGGSGCPVRTSEYRVAERATPTQIVCITSVEELEKLSGVTGIKDLHRENIDHITIPSKQGKGDLKRVEEVFDCWFESGRYVGVCRLACDDQSSY